MESNALRYNTLSESNGQLMRCTPIPAFLHGLSYTEIADVARADAKLSHPSKICQDCAALYSIAIAYLINHQDDPYRSENAMKFVESFPGTSDKVLSWLQNSKKELPENTTNCLVNARHVKHAFTLAFHFLQTESAFQEAILETLKLGGDTCSNGYVVGGMIGALHGFSTIPDYMTHPVFNFDPTTVNSEDEKTLGYRRPSMYRAINVMNYSSTTSS